MGQNQEAFRRQPFDHGSGQFFRLHHTVNRGRFGGFGIGRHGGAHGLRAQHGNFYALMRVSQRQPFAKTDSGMFGHTIGRAANLIEQTGG